MKLRLDSPRLSEPFLVLSLPNFSQHPVLLAVCFLFPIILVLLDVPNYLLLFLLRFLLLLLWLVLALLAPFCELLQETHQRQVWAPNPLLFTDATKTSLLAILLSAIRLS